MKFYIHILKLFKFQKKNYPNLEKLYPKIKKMLSPVYGQIKEKLKIMFSKSLLQMSSFDHNKLLYKLFEIICISDEVVEKN